MLVALVAGHRPSKPGGAKSVDGTWEHPWCLEVVALLSAALTRRTISHVVIHRPDHVGAYKLLPRLVNRTGADLLLSLHFNGFRDPDVGGSETLHAGSRMGEAFAEAIHGASIKALGREDRGLKRVAVDERGGPLLHRSAMPAALDEPGFGTNAGDWAAMRDNQGHLAEAYADAIRAFGLAHPELGR